MALGHGVHHGSRTEHGVAAGEQAGDAGGEGVLVGGDPPAGRPGRTDSLPDGHDDRVSLQNSCLGVVEPRIELLVLIEDTGAGAESDGAVLDLGWAEAVVEGHTFFEGLGGFPGVRRHFRAALQTGHLHRFHAGQPSGATCGVHGDVAAANHHHVRADGRPLAAIDLVQEIQTGPDARGILAGDVELAADPRARSGEDGVKAGFQKTLRFRNARAGLSFDAEIQDVLDLLVEDVVGQAVTRNAVAEHAAQARLRLEQGHAVAEQGQVGSGRQAGRAAADDGDLAIEFVGCGLGGRILLGIGVDVVGDETLEVADVHGVFDFAAVAVVLAGMLAHPAASGGKRAALADELVGFLELGGGGERDVALRVHAGGAGGFARGAPGGLGDSKDVGDGLRIRAEDGLAGAQAAVELAREIDGARLGTLTAGVALGEVHVARVLANLDFEVAGLAGDSLHVGQGDDLDVLVARALHQLGREDAHGAVAGGEGLVQPGHAAADGRRGVQEVDLEAALGQVQRGLDAGDAGPADEHGADGFVGALSVSVVSHRGHIPLDSSSPCGSTTRLRKDSSCAEQPMASPSNCVK